MSGLPNQNEQNRWQDRLDELYQKRLSDLKKVEPTIQNVSDNFLTIAKKQKNIFKKFQHQIH